MSLAGTSIVILYVMFYEFTKRIEAKWRYRILKISLFYFLCPLSLFKYDLLSILLRVSSLCGFNLESGVNKRIQYTNMIVRHESSYYATNLMKVKWCCLTLIGLISFILVIRELFNYYKVKIYFRNLKRYGIKHDDILEEIQGGKNDLRIKKKIDVVISDLNNAPCTIGIFKPVICLPQKLVDNLETSDLSMVILHELLHIKNNDLVIKFITLLTIAVNWFNPLCYFVFYEICAMSEICCDFEIVKEKGKEDINDYCALLIDIAANSYKQERKVMSEFAISDKTIIKRRIMEMKKKKNKLKRFIPAMLSTFIFMVGGTTVLAYGKTPEVDVKSDSFSYDKESFSTNDSWSQFSETENGFASMDFGDYFETEDGTLEKIDLNLPEARHTHTYVKGLFYSHIPQGTGCKMECFNAKKCSLCGYTVVYDLISTTVYAKCPHK